ncbi:uncharacterized protein FOMMEDRAFT_145329 [Fomitiporia mediterranea MF3/22]|uniref:uncharacterized protein n=1 Tax=Fomitiporia mediterranea (strain MF3/22) TaxID=694068 RepID=UPI000440958B|nr:uncharacterized protein FOMMEDRAFT_145329 [Fomitiporia mediterranea MF3/22]EJD05994.1 hypothetical protein FOMMEDRAFT_145329 [Fomitiporia mediterranea MF3/22]
MVEEGADVGFKYNDTNDAFTLVVGNKKRRKQRQHKAHSTPAELLERSKSELLSDSVWMEKCTHICQDAITSLPGEINTILCLGLGSPTESAQARFQFCFLLELRDKIFSSQVRIRAFDPVFSTVDILLLTSLGAQILPDNKEGKYEFDGPTLAFMPHCDRELYENFLQANWSAKLLTDFLLIGNDLRRYVESVPARVLGKESPCLSRLAPLLVSSPLPEHHSFPNAFSTTSVQHISSASLATGAQRNSFDSLFEKKETPEVHPVNS